MIENIITMDQRRPPEYIIEVFADPSSVKDVVRGMLPLLAFHTSKERIKWNKC
jgi:autophagy-related protein 101